MSYFKNFPVVPYRFGDEAEFNLHQALTTYADIVDDVKDNIAFYNIITIQDERPDQLSQLLYGDHSFYWTFYILNDHIRRSGWALSDVELEKKVKERFPNTVLVSRSNININSEGALHFNRGQTITGVTSGETATIIDKNADLGQIYVSGTKNFSNGELILDPNGNAITLYSSSEEYNAAIYYTTDSDERADFDPSVGPGVLLREVTVMDKMIEENNKLRDLRIIKPGSINQVIDAWNLAMENG